MRFMKLYRFTGNNPMLKEVAEILNREEYAIIPNECLDDVCTMLAEAEVYHLLTERKKDETTIVVYANEYDYHKGLAQLQVRESLPIVYVEVADLLSYIEFDHPDYLWVECNAGEWIYPQDIVEAMKKGVKGVMEPYDGHKFFAVDRDWHIRRVIHLVENKDHTPIWIGAKEDEEGEETDIPIIYDGKHRFMAAVVRKDKYIRAFIQSDNVRKSIRHYPTTGFMPDDISVPIELSRKRITLRKGESFEIVELEDISARVRMLEGEGKGKTFFFDRMLLSL